MTSIAFTQRFRFSLALAILAALHLGLEIMHGGVVTHHLLARADMPGISNWWGLLLLPALAWFLYPFMSDPQTPSGLMGLSRAALYRLGGAIFYGGILAISFELGSEQIPAVMMGILIPLGMVFPLYRAELILGMVVGMTYTFGAVIPTIATSAVAIASCITHSTARYLVSKIWAMKR